MLKKLLPLAATGLMAVTMATWADEAAQPSDGKLPGIDVSHFQGEVDWATVRRAGAHFAFVKVSEGLHTTDAHFVANWSGASGAGILVGGYHLFHPGEDAKAQAEHFLSQLHAAGVDYKGALPPVLDIETAEGVRPQAYHEDILVWLKHVEAALGCKPIIYTSPNFWDRHEEHKHLRGHDLWLADYDDNVTLPDGWNRWLFWQHTQTGSIDGIHKPVDRNWFAGDRDALESLRCQ